MNAKRYLEIQSEGGVVNFSNRAKFRLTGGDRVRYLNGQLTNDVRLAIEKKCAIYACVTDIKGRIVGDVYVRDSEEEGALYLDAVTDLREVLGPRLERYIIADDVELMDVTEDWQLWHFFGKASAGRTEGVEAMRLGCSGRDVWLPRGASAPSSDGLVLTSNEVEQWRILQGIPQYPQELAGEVFPPEAGLDERAMSYTKGCYIGQEILSRIRTTGKMPRRLVRWSSNDSNHGISPGDEWVPISGAGRVGQVTSVTEDPITGRGAGLGYVKSSAVIVDSELLVSGGEPRIEHRVKISPLVNQ